MRDVSYELLDLLGKYEGDEQKLLQNESRPEYLYALSGLRENLLEWYPFAADGSILSVGSDYGALTGLLARNSAKLVVLDELDENLAVNRMRHSKFTHVTYQSGSLETYQSREPFDHVVMIGTGELSNPSSIQKAKGLVKKGGTLIAALHNAFSLSRFAGAVRDEGTPEACLDQVRQMFEGCRLYYPVPDYRLPVCIYSDTYLPRKGDLTNVSTPYDYPKYQLLDEEQTFDRLCQAGQFERFASSYLIVWTKEDDFDD